MGDHISMALGNFWAKNQGFHKNGFQVGISNRLIMGRVFQIHMYSEVPEQDPPLAADFARKGALFRDFSLFLRIIGSRSI